jgi:putative methionine-R-sulfoxide reductase with GAF domain
LVLCDTIEPMPANANHIARYTEQLAERLAKCHAEREVAWALTEATSRALSLDDCVVYLCKPGQALLYQVAAYGQKQKAMNIIENAITLRFGQGIVGSCAQSGRCVRVADTAADSRYVLDDDQRHAEIAVPIRHGEQLFGVLDSEHRQAGFYQDLHEQVMQQLAMMAAHRLSELSGA